MTTDEFIAGHHHTFRITVAWGDMDALGHVNNAKYFSYMESARIDFLHKFQNLMPMPRSGVGPVLAFIDCQFSVPIVFPDEVIVGSRITEIGNTSVKMEQAIYSTKMRDAVASSKSVLVLINYMTNEKVRIPDGVRDWMKKT